MFISLDKQEREFKALKVMVNNLKEITNALDSRVVKNERAVEKIANLVFAIQTDYLGVREVVGLHSAEIKELQYATTNNNTDLMNALNEIEELNKKIEKMGYWKSVKRTASKISKILPFIN